MSHEGALVARCPAKINLHLRILGRRADGYHELRTVFQTIDLWDELEATPDPALRLACDDPALPTDGTNLVLRAAEALRAHLPGPAPGAALRLRKRIPVGGGLGGGSSNAAGALLLLLRLWGMAPGRVPLGRIAASLGSDVPFFLLGGTALGTGRGEHVVPLPSLAGRWLVLGIPPFALATSRVYGLYETSLTPRGTGGSFPAPPRDKSLRYKDFGVLSNDLEDPVLQGWPDLRRYRDALADRGALRAMISGSGSCIFGLFGGAAEARRATEGMSGEFPEWTSQSIQAVRRAAHVEEGGSSA